MYLTLLNWYLEAKEDLEYFDNEFYATDSVDWLWSYSVFVLLCFKNVRFSLLLKRLFSNKYYIL
jgi:hypothetical protein